jgi:hypothetical protein
MTAVPIREVGIELTLDERTFGIANVMGEVGCGPLFGCEASTHVDAAT